MGREGQGLGPGGAGRAVSTATLAPTRLRPILPGVSPFRPPPPSHLTLSRSDDGLEAHGPDGSHPALLTQRCPVIPGNPDAGSAVVTLPPPPRPSFQGQECVCLGTLPPIGSDAGWHTESGNTDAVRRPRQILMARQNKM